MDYRALVLWGTFFLKKTTDRSKIGISEIQQTGLLIKLRKSSRVINLSSHSKHFATRYTTSKNLHTVFDGFRVPWTQFIKSNVEKNLTQSYKKCADHKRTPKGIGSTIKEAKARNKQRRGNIYNWEKYGGD